MADLGPRPLRHHHYRRSCSSSSSSSSGSSRRKTASFGAAWCCSFTVPPSSPDLRSSFANPSKQPPKTASAAASPSPMSDRRFTRRILSPGRVSPIDSDPPLPPPPEAADSVGPAVAAVELVGEVSDPVVEVREVACGRGEGDGGLDLRVRLMGKEGSVVVLELDSRVLCESSAVFKEMLKGEMVEVGEVDNVGAYRETIEMMYEEDLMRWLMKVGVSRAIDLLEVSFKIMFNRGVESCLNYIEAVPWSESEEEKLKHLFARYTFDEAMTQDILARLQPEGTSGSNDLAIHLIQSIAEGTNGNACKELQSLVSGLLSKSSVYHKDPVGLTKESLYRICHSCLNLLVVLFEEASGSTLNSVSTTKGSKPLIERVSKQVENLNWLLEILILRQMAEDFVCSWADQRELITIHQKASPMVRYELSRVSACVFIALGKGKLRCPADIRFAVLDSWFRPMLVDFGWLQRCPKGLDIRMLEEGLGQAILTLPLNQQQSLFVEWFRWFGGKGTECPNLSKAFQVWWRRSFVRT